MQSDGKFFPADSPVRQYTEMLGQFKDIAKDAYGRSSDPVAPAKQPITVVTSPIFIKRPGPGIVIKNPQECPEPDKYAELDEDEKLELPAKCLALFPWQLRGEMCPSSEEYQQLNENQQQALEEACLTQEKSRKLEELKAKLLKRTVG